jgi:RHS repeat-associated protein
MLDSSGAKIGEMRYYPYGETRSISGSVPTDRRFTGQRQEDSGLGSLYDYGARLYSPAIGRFLSADTIVPRPHDPQSWNRFSYTRNNPLKYTDPTGHHFDPFGDEAGGGRGPDIPPAGEGNGTTTTGAGPGSGGGGTVYSSGAAEAGSMEAEMPALPADTLITNSPGDTIANIEAGNEAAAVNPEPVSSQPSGANTLEPGPYAGESIPARGPGRDFTALERGEIDRIGQATGCHTCGTTDPGTVSGHFILDHQPPSRLNFDNLPQRLYPQCLSCSLRQGGEVLQAILHGLQE